MTEIIGKPTSRTAKPLIMTFYDWLKTYPYTAKFYLREDASDEECLEFINAVCAVTECVLGKYTIGFQQYRVPIPDLEERFKAMPNGTMGTRKWVIKYYTEPDFRLRTHTIPGNDFNLSLRARLGGGAGKEPDTEHPLWVKFVEVFKRVCVSKENEPIPDNIQLEYGGGNWPPKGWKRK